MSTPVSFGLEHLSNELRACHRDPAREARLARNLSQRCFINGQWGQAEFHLNRAIEWEAITEQALRLGLRLVGESQRKVLV